MQRQAALKGISSRETGEAWNWAEAQPKENKVRLDNRPERDSEIERGSKETAGGSLCDVGERDVVRYQHGWSCVYSKYQLVYSTYFCGDR